jgi:hypothetical protein
MNPSRPRPPDLSTLGDFAPDLDGLGAWAHSTFIREGGALHNEAHGHLHDAAIGWLWTNYGNSSRGRTVVGECRLVRPLQNTWTSAQSHYQLMKWFGHLPDFVITISAEAAEWDDWSFCALIEHELYHAAQAEDEFGMPRFTKEGLPIFTMRGHDVEQFVDVVARYGATAAGVDAMVRAANKGPMFGQANIEIACGTCAARRAA